MPSIYNDNFPYSATTERLSQLYPSWTAIRKNTESVGQQFLNVFALEADSLIDEFNSSIGNLNLSTARLSEPYQVYKFVVPATMTEIDLISTEGEISSTTYTVIEDTNLRDFYKRNNSEDYVIYDFENSVGYVHREYDSIVVSVNGSQYTISDFTLAHVWNVFDEFALSYGIYRRQTSTYIEDNISLKNRIKNKFKFIAKSDKSSLINGIAVDLGLISSTTWNAETSTKTITADNISDFILISKEPIIVSYLGEEQVSQIPYKAVKVHESQIQSKTSSAVILRSSISVLYRDDFKYNLSKCVFDNKVLKILPGNKNGTLISPIIDPGNLKTWKNVSVTGTTLSGICLEIFSSSYLIYSDLNSLLYKCTLDDISGAATALADIDEPIVIKLTLSRATPQDTSPALSSVVFTYDNERTKVEYIAGISIDSFSNDSFVDSMTNDDGSPGEELSVYINELHKVSPIMWDEFVWDYSYWNTVDDNLCGFREVPQKWDIPANTIVEFQNGVYDEEDLLVSLKYSSDSITWNPIIASGFFYNSEEYYLFETPTTVSTVASVSEVKIDGDIAGKIIVKRGSTYLKQVAFIDDEYAYSIANTESIISDGSNHIYINYQNPISINIAGFTGTVDGTIKNKINLTPTPTVGQELVVSYRVSDSFLVEKIVESGTEKTKITFSSAMANTSIIYEGGSGTYLADEINLDPKKNHLSEGFIFMETELRPPTKIVCSMDPDILLGDGFSIAHIIVDVFDTNGNPVHLTDYTGTSIGDYTILPPTLIAAEGTLTAVSEYYNRKTYRYMAPSAAASFSKTMTFKVRDSLSQNVQVNGADISDSVTISIVVPRTS